MKQTNNFTKFVRPYSRGQITIPQNFRDYLGISDNDWLFLSIKDNYLIIKPVKESQFLEKKEQKTKKAKLSFKKYLQSLAKIKGSFGNKILKENQKIRKEIDNRLKRHQF